MEITSDATAYKNDLVLQVAKQFTSIVGIVMGCDNEML